MGIFDTIRTKTEKVIDQHGEKVANGIDRAAATASSRTGGKHDDRIGKVASGAKGALTRLDGRTPPPSA